MLAAYLFGSQASGQVHRESDVDLAVLLDRSVLAGRSERDAAQLRITSDLIAVLSRNDVEVVILNDVSPLFARAILRTGRLLFATDGEPVRNFERDVQLRAADLEPFIQRGRRRLLDVLRQ